jgi:transcription-repair coupling factor (superfamily II helicase)
MSIVGIRDMSVIYEPPKNRRPVQTYVLEYDEEVIREAIIKELERQGQVFYLYNRVETIEKKASEISRLIPEARVAFALSNILCALALTSSFFSFSLTANCIILTSIILFKSLTCGVAKYSFTDVSGIV